MIWLVRTIPWALMNAASCSCLERAARRVIIQTHDLAALRVRADHGTDTCSRSNRRADRSDRSTRSAPRLGWALGLLHLLVDGIQPCRDRFADVLPAFNPVLQRQEFRGEGR